MPAALKAHHTKHGGLIKQSSHNVSASSIAIRGTRPAMMTKPKNNLHIDVRTIDLDQAIIHDHTSCNLYAKYVNQHVLLQQGDALFFDLPDNFPTSAFTIELGSSDA